MISTSSDNRGAIRNISGSAPQGEICLVGAPLRRDAAVVRWRANRPLPGLPPHWHIPAARKNAKRGKWVLSPGNELFDVVTRALPGAQIIAEDLGKLTPQASALRDRFDFPGMRIMQFGFGAGGSYHLPHRFTKRCVAYTGTHDTTRWLAGLTNCGRAALHSESVQIDCRK